MLPSAAPALLQKLLCNALKRCLVYFSITLHTCANKLDFVLTTCAPCSECVGLPTGSYPRAAAGRCLGPCQRQCERRACRRACKGLASIVHLRGILRLHAAWVHAAFHDEAMLLTNGPPWVWWIRAQACGWAGFCSVSAVFRCQACSNLIGMAGKAAAHSPARHFCGVRALAAYRRASYGGRMCDSLLVSCARIGPSAVHGVHTRHAAYDTQHTTCTCKRCDTLPSSRNIYMLNWS